MPFRQLTEIGTRLQEAREIYRAPRNDTGYYASLAKRLRGGMMSKDEFLAEVERRAKTRAEIAGILNLAPSRITEMYKGERDLSYDEAQKLAQAYGIEPTEMVTAELLMPILRICLRHPPKEWTDRAVQRLAEEIEYGLELLRLVPSRPPNPDALAVVARAITDRFRDKPA